MNTLAIRDKLRSANLKVTPQRLAIYEAIYELGNHPTVEQIITYIKNIYPNIATGTVYAALETFVARGLVRKVKTDNDLMRYDAMLTRHHHLYCAESDKIEDYVDEKLDTLLVKYFKNKHIPGFSIKDIKLQIVGIFNKNH
jgi:Fur family peroxide stress response transcriptional regulator